MGTNTTEYMQKYYRNNKEKYDKIREEGQVMWHCSDCNKSIKSWSKNSHCKTKTHKRKSGQIKLIKCSCGMNVYEDDKIHYKTNYHITFKDTDDMRLDTNY